jgi:hypothetical protein
MTPLRFDLTAFDRIAVAVAAMSVVTLVVELTWPHELEAPVAAEAPVELVQAAEDFVPVGSLSEYLSISEHPLFTYDRRPFVFVVEAAPVPIGPRVEFELTAVVLTRDTRIALLRSNLRPTVQRVVLNQSIDGWVLADLTPDSVVLRQGEAVVTVPLRPDLGGARSGHAARIDPTSGTERRP